MQWCGDKNAGKGMLYARDYALVQRSLAGDETAWEELYRQAYPVVYRDAHNRCQTDFDAKEIVAEAFFRCYDKRDTFLALSRFSTWVCGYVRYVALEYHRMLFRQLPVACTPWEKLFAEPIDSEWDPLIYLIRQEQRCFLRMAYCSLNARQKTLIAWHVLNLFSQREAMARTGLSRKRLAGEAEIAV